ncbi:MAG: bifunctional diguanylate cyclase/phosphodiesterase [Cellulomonadaceae bacterium]|nr:bifunctional diguanylate cyclase/phosphodiesterase [Cellulomonadaceae bacterium]
MTGAHRQPGTPPDRVVPAARLVAGAPANPGARTALWHLDPTTGRVTWENHANALLDLPAGPPPASVDEMADIAHPDDRASVAAALDALRNGTAIEVSFRLATDPGRTLSLHAAALDPGLTGRADRIVGLVVDVPGVGVAVERHRPPAADAVSGIVGAQAFDAAMSTELRRCARSLEPLSVLLLDVGGLDRTPQEPGCDRAVLVTAVSEALSRTAQRAGDVLAHLGGDRFAMVLPGVAEAGALAVADRLVEVIRTVEVPGPNLTTAVGCATSSHVEVSLDPAELVARAGVALQAAASAGPDRALAYDGSLDERAAFGAAIAAAVTGGELRLHFQPVVSLRTGGVLGFEALMRWERPGYGLLPPAAFIPTADESTLACSLGRWALAAAVAQLAAWTRAGLDPAGELRIAVNVSARHVAHPAILDDVRDALRVGSVDGVTPNQLELEIAEPVHVDHGPAAAHLRQLRALGVRVAIDDFGTGTTPITQLPRLAVDILKVDGTLVSASDPGLQALVGIAVTAGHAFDLAVVAEGIEDPETVLALRELGCDAGQGYWFAHPLTPEATGPWLTRWRAQVAQGW